MFHEVTPRVEIHKIEQEQIEFWRKHRVFERTTEGREDAPRFVFYEGPPTANGLPGSHHVLARVFKDIFPRYKTMRGFYCLRKGGWDTHGLPVEIEVEKELGLTNKREIEAYGIAEFNQKCRESVFRYIDDWERLTERIGFWANLDDAYITLENEYIQSVWWILRQLWDQGLIYHGYRVVNYCPRCGTPLSSHEVAQEYRETTDPSAFVRFRLRDEPSTSLIAWTTTPWTLPGNVALVVGADVEYCQLRGEAAHGETEDIILAANRVAPVLGDEAADYEVVRRFPGRELVGQAYEPLYAQPVGEGPYAQVVAADFVKTDEGSGIVHIAPAFGADDLEVAQAQGLPILHTIDAAGRFKPDMGPLAGQWFKDADSWILQELRERGLLFKREDYRHNYPFCWRCDTPLMFYARHSWFIRTTQEKQALIDLNQTIGWVPEHVRNGRFGNWLEDLKDWSLGRERFWGTPLPIWEDESNGERILVGSVAELSDLAGRDLSELDLHRPYVDEITFPNPNGGGLMRRVPEVIDVWFDSGAMPVAQWGYPFQNRKKFEEQFPADYICEAVDQTRGWFYSLHAISSLLFRSVSYKNVICLGHILDGEGRKMSKSRGNAVDPWEVLNEHGADAFRWYLFSSGPPGEPRRFSVDLVGEVVKKFWMTLWNTYSFFVTYANLDGWRPAEYAPPVAERPVLDRWLLAELADLTEGITKAYDEYDVPGATRPIQQFVDQLSNTYVRMSRRRFWKSESDADKQSAYATLYEVLVTLSKLLAPSMPFLSEAIYRNLAAQDEADTVHLAEWPEVNESHRDAELVAEMRLMQRLIRLGLAARMNAEVEGRAQPIGVRQPLAQVEFATRDARDPARIGRLAPIIAAELNVKQVKALSLEAAEERARLHYTLRPIPRLLGKRLGKDFKSLQATLRDGEQAFLRPLAQELLAGQSVTLELNGAACELSPDEVEVQLRRDVPQGFSFAEEAGDFALLDTRVDEQLAREGMAREMVRRIQLLRQEADYRIDDRIITRYAGGVGIQTAVGVHGEYIQRETLSLVLEAGDDFSDADASVKFQPGEQNWLRGEGLRIGVWR
ncbi:MAG: isoleucine--tRNA ligase [Anaerolineaceae bacterium]|nr:isoleucine--tRNA ligase [Anaerolineaceae bacterium]